MVLATTVINGVASFSAESFDTNSFSELAFFFDAVEQTEPFRRPPGRVIWTPSGRIDIIDEPEEGDYNDAIAAAIAILLD